MNPLKMPKVAVIAGVGPGLGAALARRFAAGGCRVALMARSPEYLQMLAGELNAASPTATALALPCDLNSPDQIGDAFCPGARPARSGGPAH